MMRRLSVAVVAGGLLGGCATYEPSLPGGPAGQPSPKQPSGAPSGHGEQPSEGGTIGQTRPLERGHVEASGTRGQREASRRSRNAGATPPPRNIKANASAAVMSLVKAADKAMNHMQPGRASALIERALNIAPRNPFLYQRLAAIRLVQGNPVQAVQLARKSNTLAAHNPFVKRNNWALIADARKYQGQANAAQQAVFRANKFKRISQQYSQ